MSVVQALMGQISRVRNIFGSETLTPYSEPPIPGENICGISNVVRRGFRTYYAPDDFEVAQRLAQRCYAIASYGLAHLHARKQAGFAPALAGGKDALGLVGECKGDPSEMIEREAVRLAFFAFMGLYAARSGEAGPVSEEEFQAFIREG